MIKGGIFIYPSTKNYKNVKLRLLYEYFATYFISEQTSAMVTNKKIKILDNKTIKIAEKSPYRWVEKYD